MIFNCMLHLYLNNIQGRLHGLTGSAVGHRTTTPGFKPRPGYVRRVFHISLRLITFGGRSAHLAYLAAFSVGNRVNDPLQKVGSGSPVLACKNTATPLPRCCQREVQIRAGGIVKGWAWGSGSHSGGPSPLEGRVCGSSLKINKEMEYLVHSMPFFRQYQSSRPIFCR